MKNDISADFAVYVRIIWSKFVVLPDAYYGNMAAQAVCQRYRLGRLRRYYIAV